MGLAVRIGSVTKNQIRDILTKPGPEVAWLARHLRSEQYLTWDCLVVDGDDNSPGTAPTTRKKILLGLLPACSLITGALIYSDYALW